MRKRFRLRTDAQFKRVRGAGRSWAHPLLVLYALPNEEGTTRVGFSVSKRVGKAVTRNRIKRLLREAVRVRLSHTKQSYDVILIARAPIATASYLEVAAAVEQLLRRSRLMVAVEVESSGVGERPNEARSDDGEQPSRGLAQ
ncbi:MAG: ribonuclease P protein component [Chloroflexota bacterium]